MKKKEVEIKSFPYKQKPSEFITIGPASQETLKGVLQNETKMC